MSSLWLPSLRRDNQEDQAFIEAEVGRLLAADVIGTARVPWRAQVLVKQKETKGWS